VNLWEKWVGFILLIMMNRRDFLRYKLFLVIASLNDVNMHKLEIRSDEMSGDVYASDFDLPHYISGECIDLEQIEDSFITRKVED
jgi:hypothetical protein